MFLFCIFLLFYRGIKEEELIDHIDKLHTYNEIKDIAQMLLGKIGEYFVHIQNNTNKMDVYTHVTMLLQ